MLYISNKHSVYIASYLEKMHHNIRNTPLCGSANVARQLLGAPLATTTQHGEQERYVVVTEHCIWFSMSNTDVN